MSELEHKQHNVNILIYHIVCPAKCWQAVITAEVDEKLREVCLEIEKRYEMKNPGASSGVSGIPQMKSLWCGGTNPPHPQFSAASCGVLNRRKVLIKFLEIGTERDHVHFLVQSVPTEAPARIVQKIKSITARKIFEVCPEVKKQLWGGEFWTRGYYVGTVGGEHGNEAVIAEHIKNQGRELTRYKKLYNDRQLSLFD